MHVEYMIRELCKVYNKKHLMFSRDGKGWMRETAGERERDPPMEEGKHSIPWASFSSEESYISLDFQQLLIKKKTFLFKK